MDVAAGVIRGVEAELVRLQRENTEMASTLRYTVNALIFLQDEADARGQKQLGTAIYGLRQKIVTAMSRPVAAASGATSQETHDG